MRKKLSYANVVATLGLVIAVAGGTAYAANTIRSGDIVDGEVKTADLANNSVRSAKIATGQVMSGDVKDDTLGAADLAPGAVNEDELGETAVPGHMYTIQVQTAMNTVASKEITASCAPFADRVSGGGFVIAGPGGANVPTVAVQRSYGSDNRTWLVRATATAGTPEWQLTVIANCVG